MGLPRSTFYDEPAHQADDTAIVQAIAAICEEFEHYGWRRGRATLRQQGLVVNHKKIRRLMREHGLQPECAGGSRPRRTVITISPSSPTLLLRPCRTVPTHSGWLTSPTLRSWAGSITWPTRQMLRICADVLDAWSRRVVGYAISRSIDARLTLAALGVAIEGRKPPPGCLHHSDRGSQYAAGAYHQLLTAHSLVGSMGRRKNPYDNAKAESFMKTLKVEGVYPIAFETFADVVDHLPRFIDQDCNDRRLHSALGSPSLVQFGDQHARRTVKEVT